MHTVYLSIKHIHLKGNGEMVLASL